MKIIVAVITVLLFISCNSNDESTNDDNPNANIVTDLPKDTWKITYFFYDNSDQTNSFSSFSFNFDTNGTVIASNDILSTAGTWSYEDASNDSIDDDGIENDEELILVFSESNLFNDLTDNWHITMATQNKVELFDESSDGTMQFLTFTKE
ncbi:hypothetical protein ATE92_2001 [Ulvibacter sp. MAR_2010_11]|uniref:hypothetical protein n=1 Tax=Ulvibacter sp. MAR_2010_11 TaxID=1250229 RepID=UPI000C2B8573|nr:hypothetical protein [Ulvibacter sp. MAR_2010_11]PKA83833.1 hypothetical protein ATE92_2001 [Ulvibacter sp. MAR_2010_11]